MSKEGAGAMVVLLDVMFTDQGLELPTAVSRQCTGWRSM